MSTDARLTTLESAMTELAIAQARTQANLDRLADEMRSFKEEMRRSRGETPQFWADSTSLGMLADDGVVARLPNAFRTVFGVEPSGLMELSSFRHPQDPGDSQTFEVVAWGGGHFLVNETRRRARPEDITYVIDLVAKARLYFPQAETMKVVGSLTSSYVDPSLVEDAERQGLIVFGLGGGLLEILNSPGFKPREY